jgi:hypothetical protein
MGLDLTIKCFLALAISNLSHIMMSKDCAISRGLIINCIKLYGNEISGLYHNGSELLRRPARTIFHFDTKIIPELILIKEIINYKWSNLY